MSLDPDLTAFATAGNFGALTTLGPDGSPSTHVMWVDADGDHLLLNTEVHRQKYKNVQRDPRVAVTVIDKENPYRYVEARGRVVGEVGGQEARDHIDVCSRRYTGSDYANPIQSERVILRVEVDKVHKMGV
jgi:PPOX class probable F420-dependent enzyme